MSRKIAASRRAAFLRALAATGNFTLAAERAKVSRSWVNLHRAGDAEFRAAGDAALVAFREERALRQAQGERDCCEPPAGWGSLDGARLAVRGGNGRKVQVARARLKQWCPASEERFLAVLAATCNVRAACAEAGLSPASAYVHRGKWRNFAERWKVALDEGYMRLEAGLLECAGNVFSGTEVPADCPVREISATDAIQLLWLHREEVRGVGERPGRRWRYRPRRIEAVRASLLRKIEAIQRARDIPENVRDADRAAWAARRPGAG